MFVTESLSANLLTLLITLCVTLIVFYKWSYQYWKRKNLPYLEPTFPFGNMGNVNGQKEQLGIKIKRLYDIMKSNGWKHGGFYNLFTPMYLPIDLDLLKNIMTKDFQHFSDRGTYHNEKGDPLSAHLFNIGGVKWRNLRTKFTPTFTSGKMKMMFQTLVDCQENLQKRMKLEYDKDAPVDIKEVLGCFTTDIIGSCAFGLNFNTFEDENSPFRVFGRKAFERSRREALKRHLATAFPDFARWLNVKLHSDTLIDFFMKVVGDTVSYREKNNVSRKDFMQLLIDMKNNKLDEDDGYKHDGTTLTLEEITAQSFVFFIAGFETSSTTMTFALYELARHQDIQDRLRDEIKTVLAKHDGKITYEAIQEMKYMNQVIDEALRIYPPASFMTRRCTQDYKIPGSDIVLEKNTTVMIPILGIHHDEEYYPEPEKFDPDRFTEENKQSRHSYAHIPFGEGPRICIGMRFGLMQSKVGLASLLRNYRFTVNEKTQEPLKMKSYSIVLAAEGEIWLDAHKL